MRDDRLTRDDRLSRADRRPALIAVSNPLDGLHAIRDVESDEIDRRIADGHVFEINESGHGRPVISDQDVLAAQVAVHQGDGIERREFPFEKPAESAFNRGSGGRF